MTHMRMIFFAGLLEWNIGFIEEILSYSRRQTHREEYVISRPITRNASLRPNLGAESTYSNRRPISSKKFARRPNTELTGNISSEQNFPDDLRLLEGSSNSTDPSSICSTSNSAGTQNVQDEMTDFEHLYIDHTSESARNSFDRCSRQDSDRGTFRDRDGNSSNQSCSHDDRVNVKLKSALKRCRNREEKLRRDNKKLLIRIEELKKQRNFWRAKSWKNNDRKRKNVLKTILNIAIDDQGQEIQAERSNIPFESAQGQIRHDQNDSRPNSEPRSSTSPGSIRKKKCLLLRLSSRMNHSLLGSRNMIIARRRNIKYSKQTERIRTAVTDFLERDENSIVSPSRKDKITRNGKTKQIRFLTDTLYNLHQKYLREGNSPLSRTSFYKFKPFWIVKKKMSARDTCLCKTHDNASLLITKLAFLKILPSPDHHSLLSQLTCDQKNLSCMSRECSKCKDRVITCDKNETVSFYHQWTDEKISRLGAKNKMYDVKVTVKKKVVCTISEMVDKMNQMIPMYLKHVYLMNHQYGFLRKNILDLETNQVHLTCDFSQNYLGKYSREIARTHYGASKKQFSMHTGVFYYKNCDGELCCVSFCTVSEDLSHDGCAIWAHLQPVLGLIKEKVPEVDVIDFQSDGPTTQYKNKTNFQLFRRSCANLNLRRGSWNFTAPGHGKSSADGVGGTVKRLCDSAVLKGQDVMFVDDIIKAVQASSGGKTSIFKITTDDITAISKTVNPEIDSAPNSQKIFQLLWTNETPDILHLNRLSCSECIKTPPCSHFALTPGIWEVESAKSRKSRLKSRVISKEKLDKKGIALKKSIHEKKTKTREDMVTESDFATIEQNFQSALQFHSALYFGI
ncbi:hypothetical protein QAD02_023905 [Eretmocerus hayati]|uniref:Uncharacterized protein n=1 Tax=Eretmocerus hayati TaxID=131215 RepID=A0ACC2Q220_9HYME|nr:hypothetical protein QAD02_023905 [Eretmocerus hayati]